MKKLLFTAFISIVIGVIISQISFKSITGAPPYYVEDTQPPLGSFNEYENWKRPKGPPKVGLQAGHWKNDEVPEELIKLKGNTGASGGGKTEWEVNYSIAEQTKKILEEKGVIVDLLPATIPEKYLADVFVSVHADGNLDTSKTGFKAATPRRDLSGKATTLLTFIENAYEESTGLSKDLNVTRNMKGYYGFSYWRYTHAVHPMTTSLILETGFLTSPSDRTIIVENSKLSAQGLAKGIILFLEKEGLLKIS